MIIELKANGAEKMEVRYDPEKELMLKEFHWRPYICIVKQAGGVIRAVITGIQSWGTKSSWETLFTSYLHAGGFLRPNQKTSKPKTENVDFFFFPQKITGGEGRDNRDRNPDGKKTKTPQWSSLLILRSFNMRINIKDNVNIKYSNTIGNSYLA